MVQGLDALMVALQAWNGGVIVISHDERFITTVAKEVRSVFREVWRSVLIGTSCGFAVMGQYASLWATYKATRQVEGMFSTSFAHLNLFQ